MTNSTCSLEQENLYFFCLFVSAELIFIIVLLWLMHLENKNVEIVLQTKSTRKVCITFS